MSKCLVTRLKAVVDNENLPFFDSVTIVVRPNTSGAWLAEQFGIRIGYAENSRAVIIGNGYFTDENGSTNLGKSIDVEAGDVKAIYFSSGTYKIVFLHKQALSHIGPIKNGKYQYYTLDMTELRYWSRVPELLSWNGFWCAKGSIVNLAYSPSIDSNDFWWCGNTEVGGEVSDFGKVLIEHAKKTSGTWTLQPGKADLFSINGTPIPLHVCRVTILSATSFKLEESTGNSSMSTILRTLTYNYDGSAWSYTEV